MSSAAFLNSLTSDRNLECNQYLHRKFETSKTSSLLRCRTHGCSKSWSKITVHFIWVSNQIIENANHHSLIVKEEQECIPVRCVPAARRPYAGVCFPGRGCLLRGGVCSGGVCSGGVSALGGGGCLLHGGAGLGGRGWSGGVWSWGGGIPACTEADPHCEQNDRQV